MFSCFAKNEANLPAVVVLPAPCKPTIITTVGGFGENWNGACSPPINSVNSSLTIFTTCCAGDKASNTLEPNARSFTFRTKSFTTLKFTSASNNAKRTSRIICFKSASVIFPFFVTEPIAFCKRSDNPSNAIFSLLNQAIYSFLVSLLSIVAIDDHLDNVL